MRELETVKSALQKLKDQRQNFGILERPTVDENYAMRMALEKQIPKKMKKLDVKHQDGLCYECPNCKALYNRWYRLKPHCLNCGQAIDWSEEGTTDKTAKTNADRIRSMSVWELAEFIYNVSIGATIISVCKEKCAECEYSDSYCVSQIGEWLLKGAEE